MYAQQIIPSPPSFFFFFFFIIFFIFFSSTLQLIFTIISRYVLKIDSTYGKRGMAEVKMDDDRTLQYVPIIHEADGLQAEGNGCVKIPHRKFENMPGNVTKSWRLSLRLLAEFEVANYIQHHNASQIQRTCRAWVARRLFRRALLLDKCAVLTNHAQILNNLERLHLTPSTTVRFFLANLFIMRHGGTGVHKYKHYPAMERRRALPIELGQSFERFKRKRSITKELRVLLYKRGAAIKKLQGTQMDSVVPFVRNGALRSWRIHKVQKVKKKIERKVKQSQIRKEMMRNKRERVLKDVVEMDYLGSVVKDAGGIPWDENYQKEVKNLNLV